MGVDDLENYGKRLAPNVIDQRAKMGYSRPFALFPKTPNPSDGFHSISYPRIANSINRVCWWLDEVLPRGGTFAYFGPDDLRYIVFVIAAMKTGRKILLASHRNTIEAQRSLFEKAECSIVVSCSSQKLILQNLFSELSNLGQFQAPKLEAVLDEVITPNYTFDEAFETASNDDLVVVHSSGSSGNPRPVAWNKTYISRMDIGNSLPAEGGIALTKACFRHEIVYTLLPCFHSGGLGINLFAALFDMTLMLGYPGIPNTLEWVTQMIKQGVATVILSPPSILEEISRNPAALEDLAKLKHVIYGGGPMQPEVGTALSAKLPHLCSMIGATECGWFHQVLGDNTVWDHINFLPDIGYAFEEVSDGIFEHVILDDNRTNKYQGVFETFPGIRKYRTNDLYSAHPKLSGWWRYKGRVDDLFALSNGEKVDPNPLESIIRSHPLVRGALVIGEYRFNPCLLVEAVNGLIPTTEAERQILLEKIWSVIQEANEIAPGFSKIPKSLVMFASLKKPFLRAGKGTIQRQLTVKSYAKELDQLYSSQEKSILTNGVNPETLKTREGVQGIVGKVYREALDIADLTNKDDVFERGMDSLRARLVLQRLKATLRAFSLGFDLDKVNTRLVYSASSIDKMADAIVQLSSGAQTNGQEAHLREAKMQIMLEKYLEDVPKLDISTSASREAEIASQPWNVVLTGTSGSLGIYLLSALEAMPRSKIGKVFCLNRSADAEQRQRQLKLKLSRGLEQSTEEAERVVFFQSDFSQSNLGLSPENYATLIQEATVVIHSAWQVDFNLAFDSFESQVRGVRNLLDFSFKSSKKAPLIFTSSMSTILNWSKFHPQEKFPEAIVPDFRAPENLGYAEAKFVSEHLLDEYSKQSGLTTAVFRTGQIAGPISGKGVWNGKEWFPSIVKSSKYLGMLPDALGKLSVIEWIPVDRLALITIDLAGEVLKQDCLQTRKSLVYNLVNPSSTHWSSLSGAVKKDAGVDKLVPLKSWVEALEQSSLQNNGAILEINPGVKLLDFFHALSEDEDRAEGVSGFEFSALVRDSKNASELAAVSSDWMKMWIDQWDL